MLALISPAKKLNLEQNRLYDRHSQPDFLDQAERLVTTARQLSRKKLAGTMNLSADLAELNFQRYQDFNAPFDLDNAKQAALVFNGDTYLGLDATTLTEKDMVFAQDHLRILSGLYGLLRPLDLIQPYRLEMGARFKPPRRKDLYDFWGDQITASINAAQSERDDQTVINLASSEYFKVVKPKKLAGRSITAAFKEIKGNQTRMIGTFAKQARGMMARFIIQNRLTDPESLKSFNSGGYEFRDDLTEGDTWVFTRDQPPPPK